MVKHVMLTGPCHWMLQPGGAASLAGSPLPQLDATSPTVGEAATASAIARLTTTPMDFMILA
ncbi:MAG TPA: hypothetical protein VGH28_02410 [Polyangiaceae bacterium]